MGLFKSDRFFTSDYTPAVYTQPGIDWIENNNMATVLLRHFPELTPVLQRTANPFAPMDTLRVQPQPRRAATI